LGNGELASLAYGSLKELLQIEELYKIEEPRQGGLVARLWSVYGPFMVRYRFVFGSFSALLARRVLVLFVFAMDFVLVWTLVLWYTGRRFRVHWTLIFQFVWALVSPLCLGQRFSLSRACRVALVGSRFFRFSASGVWATQIDSGATAKRSTPRRSESNRHRSL